VRRDAILSRVGDDQPVS